MHPRAEIGVFGGTGLYEFASGLREVRMETPYGPPSDRAMVGEVEGRAVAFLPRHARDHSIPPHMINYRANLWTMKELGVERIIGPCAVGSLQAHIRPGDFVICDQFVDRTSGRRDTFYDGPIATHVSAADPYCPELRELATQCARGLGIAVHGEGTVVVIQGPRFSTRAESEWFTSMGWDVVNMTQYPECYLARELGICYASVALITDYDAGVVVENEAAVTATSIEEILRANTENAVRLTMALLRVIPHERGCACADALSVARWST